MDIRLLRSEDLDDFFALRLEGLKDAPEAFLVTHEEETRRGSAHFGEKLRAKDPDNVIFGGFAEGRLAGCAGVYRENRVKTAHKAALWGMFVSPAARGQGMAGKLVEAIVAYARAEMMAEIITLGVAASNVSARTLYERAGFKTWGVEPKSYLVNGIYQDNHHMWLPLR